MNEAYLLELINVSKNFGGVSALRNVDFQLKNGEIHGLIGENGAGKSTLIKIISGVHTDYEGVIKLKGEIIRFHSPANARERGIGTVYQELSIIGALSVAENLFLGKQLLNKFGLVDWGKMFEDTENYLEMLGIHVDVRRPAGSYSIGIQQMIEVARIIFGGAEIIILDEPTSALSGPEAERLFEFMKRLKDQNKTLIFISHFLEDVLRISDRISVMRNGNKVYTGLASETDKNFLVQQMLGVEASHLLSNQRKSNKASISFGEKVLEVENLKKRREFENINFSVRRGEILGIYGFMGAGKTALANCLFGLKKPDQGNLKMYNKIINIRSTKDAVRYGIAYVPDNRRQSLFYGKEVFKNITLTYLHQIMNFFLKKKGEINITNELIKQVGVTPANPFLDVSHLSGGNQQKVVLAKWLVKMPKLLILNEPTRGMDVGAKNEVLQVVNNLKNQGVAIILMSSEPEIILDHSDRILVMAKGKIRKELINQDITKEELMHWA